MRVLGRRLALAVALPGLSLSALAPVPAAALPAPVATSAVASSACSARPGDAALAERVGRTRSVALRRLSRAATGPTDRFPEAAAPNATRWTRRSPSAWTSGFFPASLWQAYDWTRNPIWLTRARTWTKVLRAQASSTRTHDLGFVIDTSAGRGAAIDPSRAARTSYGRTVVTAARSLANRWNPQVGAVHSATYDGRWAVIVDSAMNMELLFHAARLTSDDAEAKTLRRIGHQHLLVVARDFVRPDGTTFHRLAYDPHSGAVLGPLPGQAFSDTSVWSRGQAWALYGFANGYRETGDVRLLAAARQVAQAWMSRIGADCVPPWDFDAPPDLPQKDSSAGAIAAAGILDLAAVEPDPKLAERDRSHGLALLAPLLTRDYTTAGTGHPAILRRQSYSIPAKAVEGSYIWGDHYLLEAMTKALRVLRVQPRLSVAAPGTSAYGVPVPLVAHARLPGGAPAAGVPLTLQWRPRGGQSWTDVAAGLSSRNGRWWPTLRPRHSGSLRVISPATGDRTPVGGGYESAIGPTSWLTLQVPGRLQVSRRLPDRYVLRIPRIERPRGGRLVLQEHRAGRWMTVRRVVAVPTTVTRRRLSSVRYFRVLPMLPLGVRAVPSPVVRVPAR